MLRIAALAAVAAAVAAPVASAAMTCTAGATVAIADDFNTCTTVTHTAGTASSVTFEVAFADAAKDLNVIVWNKDSAANWYNTAPEVDNSGSGLSGTSGLIASGGASDNLLYSGTIKATAGSHTIGFSAAQATGAGGNWGVVISRNALMGPSNSMACDGTSQTWDVLVGDTSSNTITVTDSFAQYRYYVESLTMAHTAMATVGLNNMGSGSSDTTTATSTIFKDIGSFMSSIQSVPGVTVQAKSAATFYDVAANGPIHTMSLACTAAEYPTLTSDWTVNVQPSSDTKVYQVAVDDYFYKATVSTAPTGLPAQAVMDAQAFMSVTGTPNTMAVSASWTSAASVENTGLTAFPAMSSSNPTVSNFRKLAPGGVQFKPRVFVKISADTRFGSTAQRTAGYDLKATVEGLGGECPTGYDQCNVAADDHPSGYYSASANNDPARMRHCVIIPSAEDTSRPTTKCAECIGTGYTHCGGGKYCHMDLGLASQSSNSGNAYFLVDRESYRNSGLCIAKDPTNTIFGQPCRTTSYSTTNDISTTSTGLVVKNEGAAQADSLGEGISGSKFCGGLRFFNASFQGYTTLNRNGQIVDSLIPAVAGSARAVTWTGLCYRGMCIECTEGSTSNGLQCINGKYVPIIVVDGTSRTFGNNTVAGTMLAAVFMLILLQLCVCVRIIQEKSASASAVAAAKFTKVVA